MAAITSTGLTGSSCYATTSDPMVIYIDETSYSSNLVELSRDVMGPDLEAILEAREANRQRSAEGVRMAQVVHQRTPKPEPSVGLTYQRLPTVRRTATATRNFRRR